SSPAYPSPMGAELMARLGRDHASITRRAVTLTTPLTTILVRRWVGSTLKPTVRPRHSISPSIIPFFLAAQRQLETPSSTLSSHKIISELRTLPLIRVTLPYNHPVWLSRRRRSRLTGLSGPILS